MKVRNRDANVNFGKGGATGIERGATGGAKAKPSSTTPGGLGAERERGRTRASQPVGHSQTTETLCKCGPSRYGNEKGRHT